MREKHIVHSVIINADEGAVTHVLVNNPARGSTFKICWTRWNKQQGRHILTALFHFYKGNPGAGKKKALFRAAVLRRLSA